jgi:S1-C subfamily serine protease
VVRTTDLSDVDLAPGDIIHAVNNFPVTSIEMLRDELAKLQHGNPIVLQVERDDGLQYAAFEKE